MKFFKEFKEFIARGNVVDLAVAVIIGGAFGAIVTAFTNKIIMPIVNLVLSVGGDGISSAYTFLKTAYLEDGATIDLANSIYIDWGAFITAVIDFLIIALVVFTIVKILNISSKKLKAMEDAAKNLPLKERKELWTKAKAQAKDSEKKAKEIYASLLIERENDIKQKAEEDARIEAEKELAERLANPTQEDLLKEIRDLLKEKKN